MNGGTLSVGTFSKLLNIIVNTPDCKIIFIEELACRAKKKRLSPESPDKMEHI